MTRRLAGHSFWNISKDAIVSNWNTGYLEKTQRNANLNKVEMEQYNGETIGTTISRLDNRLWLQRHIHP